MSTTQVRMSDWLSQGFELYKKHLFSLLLPAILVVVVSVMSFGILAGPMMAGFIMIVLRLKDGKDPKPGPADVFNGFSVFLPSFLFMLCYMIVGFFLSLVLGIIPLIGGALGFFATYALAALVLFSMFLIVDRKLDFWPAVMESVERVKLDFWPFLGFTVIISVISVLGVIACFVGIVVTLPFYYCAAAVAYRDVYGGGQESADVDVKPEIDTVPDTSADETPPPIPPQ